MDKISDYMSKELLSVPGDCSILEAVDIMRKNKAGSILIKEDGEIVGIFTERDLLNKVDYSKLADGKISEVMTRQLKTVNAGEVYTNVIDLMQRSNIRHLPVEEAGRIIGIVSLRDLLNHYHENLEHLLEETVAALSYAVEKRDPYTAGHQQRVTQLATEIAKRMDLSEKMISGVSLAAIIHDIGKMYIPAEILNKPGKLTQPEITLIKIHPQMGYDILKGIEFPWPIAQIVLQHHERLDGSGYPDGLKGDEILKEARIVGLADVVEATATHRPYRAALGIDKALVDILQNKGVLYDSDAVDICMELFQKENFNFESE